MKIIGYRQWENVTDHRVAGWRIPFGIAGILAFFLEVIATPDVDPNMRSQTLRLIGNACADTGSLTIYPRSFQLIDVSYTLTRRLES